MATRFYAPHDSGPAAAVSPAVGSAWDITPPGFARFETLTTKQNTSIFSETGTDYAETSAEMVNVIHKQWVSEQIAAQTISGTFSAVFRGGQSNNAADASLQVVLRVVSGDGSTERGVLYNGHTATLNSTAGALGEEFLTGSRTRIMDTITMTNVTAHAGDRIVIEVGQRFHNTQTTSRNGWLTLGDNTSAEDFALTSGLTTSLCCWTELSGDITFGGEAVNSGSASGTVTVDGSAAGAKTSQGTASGTVTLSGSATGEAPSSVKQGAASGTVTIAGTAAGQTSTSGTASGSVTLDGSASGARISAGSIAGTVTLNGSVSGTSTFQGSVSGTVTLTGTASGGKDPAGSAAGTVTVNGSAGGSRLSSAAASGTVTIAVSASGTASRAGSASGTVTLSGAAVGGDGRVGSASGTVTLTGSASGGRISSGSASGATTIHGSVTGATARSGSAGGTCTLAATAAGARLSSGMATVTLTLTGQASGVAALGTFRDIVLTVEALRARYDTDPLTERFDVAALAHRWSVSRLEGEAMHKVILVSAGGAGYVGGTVTEVNGEDISGATFMMSLGSRQNPGAWVAPSVSTAGPGGNHERVLKLLVTDSTAKGTHYAWARITDSPEIEPVVFPMEIIVR